MCFLEEAAEYLEGRILVYRGWEENLWADLVKDDTQKDRQSHPEENRMCRHDDESTIDVQWRC